MEIEESDLVHKAKRRSSVSMPVDEETKRTHEEQKKALQEELQKPKPTKSIVKKLMEGTSAGRIHWIDQECPMVEEILSEYPPLRSGKMVSIYRSFEFTFMNYYIHCQLIPKLMPVHVYIFTVLCLTPNVLPVQMQFIANFQYYL